MDIEKIITTANELRNMANTPNILHEPILLEYVAKIRDDLSFIAHNVKQEQPVLSEHLQNLQINMFVQQYGNPNVFINSFAVGQVLESLDALQAFYIQKRNDLWYYVHPLIIKASQKLYLDGHYANAAEDAFIEVNAHIKKLYSAFNPNETKIPDGVTLMNKLFSEDNPLVSIHDRSTQTGRDIHNGYRFMLAGAMSALRNPKAHSNDEKLSPEEAMRRLMFASMLMYKIDEVKL